MSELDQNQLAQLQQSVSVEQIQLSEKLGAIKATNFIKKLVTVTEIKLIAEIKETKQYKGLKVIDSAGELVTVTTFEDFCQYLGKSREHVDEDIRNLGAFGEDFLETSQRIGLGYRDLRKLRKLDDADREVIINGESVKTEDRESLIDLIEEMSAKHRKQKDALESENKELKADKEALETVLQKKDEKVNQLDTQVTKLNSPAEIKRRAESEPQELEKAALETLGTESILFLAAFNRYTNALGGVMDIAESKDLPQLFESVDESLVATCQRFAHFVQRLGTQVSFEEILSPSWMFPETADTDTAGQ
jgi:molecular chaperone GrpE (heat shock protein)